VNEGRDGDRERRARRVEQFEKLRAAEPDDLLVRFGLANEYYEMGRYAEAVEEAWAALRLKPDYSAAYRVLGRALIEQGDVEEARRVLTEGVALADRVGDIMTMKQMRTMLKQIDRAAGDTRARGQA
jgi:predicted Zn-dependent protease